MFVVVSFDFGGSSSVALHACTEDRTAAEALYEELAASRADYNRRHRAEGMARLVELLEVPDGYASRDGAVLFWSGGGGSRPCGVAVLRSNNVG